PTLTDAYNFFFRNATFCERIEDGADAGGVDSNFVEQARALDLLHDVSHLVNVLADLVNQREAAFAREIMEPWRNFFSALQNRWVGPCMCPQQPLAGFAITAAYA